MGQTVEDLERAVPAIRDAAGAHSARSAVVSPGTLRIELVMREELSTVGHAASPTALAKTRVTLGRCENGSAWTLPLRGRHTLTVGCSGAGKGSVFWGIAGGLGPAVAAGAVRLVGIDLKYGIELSVGSGLFTTIATTEADAVETLAVLEKLMDKRGNAMAGRTRDHVPTTASPLVVVLIDELAGVTAYMSDPALRKEAATSLSRILTRAVLFASWSQLSCKTRAKRSYRCSDGSPRRSRYDSVPEKKSRWCWAMEWPMPHRRTGSAPTGRVLATSSRRTAKSPRCDPISGLMSKSAPLQSNTGE